MSVVRLARDASAPTGASLNHSAFFPSWRPPRRLVTRYKGTNAYVVDARPSRRSGRRRQAYVPFARLKGYPGILSGQNAPHQPAGDVDKKCSIKRAGHFAKYFCSHAVIPSLHY